MKKQQGARLAMMKSRNKPEFCRFRRVRIRWFRLSAFSSNYTEAYNARRGKYLSYDEFQKYYNDTKNEILSYIEQGSQSYAYFKNCKDLYSGVEGVLSSIQHNMDYLHDILDLLEKENDRRGGGYYELDLSKQRVGDFQSLWDWRETIRDDSEAIQADIDELLKEKARLEREIASLNNSSTVYYPFIGIVDIPMVTDEAKEAELKLTGVEPVTPGK